MQHEHNDGGQLRPRSIIVLSLQTLLLPTHSFHKTRAGATYIGVDGEVSVETARKRYERE
jgi:hypothetical protein